MEAGWSGSRTTASATTSPIGGRTHPPGEVTAVRRAFARLPAMPTPDRITAEGGGTMGQQGKTSDETVVEGRGCTFRPSERQDAIAVANFEWTQDEKLQGTLSVPRMRPTVALLLPAKESSDQRFEQTVSPSANCS